MSTISKFDFGKLNQSKANESTLAIIESGTTCTQANGIAKGQYILWRGVLYTADSAISLGDTLYSSGGNKNLTECENGGLNQLNNKFSNFLLQRLPQVKVSSSNNADNFNYYIWYYWDYASHPPQNAPSVLGAGQIIQIYTAWGPLQIANEYSSASIYLRKKYSTWNSWAKVSMTSI